MLPLVKDIAITLASLITVITFIMATLQYVHQSRHARAAQFVDMRRRFLEDPTFRTVLNLLAADDPSLRDVPIQDRRNLVGFLEEVALLVNSRLLDASVAHYMFGYYVLLVDDSEHFWEGLDRNSEYWSVFRQFAGVLRGGLTPERAAHF